MTLSDKLNLLMLLLLLMILVPVTYYLLYKYEDKCEKDGGKIVMEFKLIQCKMPE